MTAPDHALSREQREAILERHRRPQDRDPDVVALLDALDAALAQVAELREAGEALALRCEKLGQHPDQVQRFWQARYGEDDE